MTHTFDAALRLTPIAEHAFAGETSPDYANMVGPFGGITCAVLLNAAHQHPDRRGEPLSLTVNFASPISDGRFLIETLLLRTNRSTQHWNLLLKQGDGICASASVVFAQRRPTWSAQESMPPPRVPLVESLQRASDVDHPAFARCYDMRFPSPEMSNIFDDCEQSHSANCAWLRDHPPRQLDFASLAAICDVFYPRIFIRRRRRMSIGTVTITTYFHADSDMLTLQADRHMLGAAHALNYHNGYFDQRAEIWGTNGQLLASTHQMVYFRENPGEQRASFTHSKKPPWVELPAAWETVAK